MDKQLNAQNLALKYMASGCSKLLFLSTPVIENVYIRQNVLDILNLIKLEKTYEAEEKIKNLKCDIPIEKLLMYLSTICTVLMKEDLPALPTATQALMMVYSSEPHRMLLKDITLLVTHDLFTEFLNLAKERDNTKGAAYELLLILLNFFKALGNYEPIPVKKIREDLEYVFLIEMYLNGSKELPEKTSGNFDYTLLSQFLKKDDLMVLKSLEDYIDSAETKAMGAAGSVAQSIEKEDLEPGVKKKKKDIKRIEELE